MFIDAGWHDGIACPKCSSHNIQHRVSRRVSLLLPDNIELSAKFGLVTMFHCRRRVRFYVMGTVAQSEHMSRFRISASLPIPLWCPSAGACSRESPSRQRQVPPVSRSCCQFPVGDSVLKSLADKLVHANQRVNLVVPLIQPESHLIDMPGRLLFGDMMPYSVDAAHEDCPNAFHADCVGPEHTDSPKLCLTALWSMSTMPL